MSMVQQFIILSSFSDLDMEIVPNSSGEGSTCDEEMSQEFPPPAGRKRIYKANVPSNKLSNLILLC